MIFTQEQIQEIYSRLRRLGIKDTDFPPAHEVDGSETIAIVQDSVNKKIPLSLIFDSPAFESYYKLLIDTITEKENELNSIVDEVRERKIGLSNNFGDGETVGINQKVLTQAINKLWQKIEDMTGEILQGINMTVTPDYFISEDGTTVHITANTVEANGIFEKIQFYGNGTLIAEYENTDYVEFDTHIDETTVIMCKAQIMGVEYTRQHVITHYNSFLIGAGDSYADLMLDAEHFNPDYAVPVTEGLRGSNPVDVPEGKHIIIVLGESLRQAFMRADISFTEIEFTEQEVTIYDKTYAVLTSVNTYEAGTYKVFING